MVAIAAFVLATSALGSVVPPCPNEVGTGRCDKSIVIGACYSIADESGMVECLPPRLDFNAYRCPSTMPDKCMYHEARGTTVTPTTSEVPPSTSTTTTSSTTVEIQCVNCYAPLFSNTCVVFIGNVSKVCLGCTPNFAKSFCSSFDPDCGNHRCEGDLERAVDTCPLGVGGTGCSNDDVGTCYDPKNESNTLQCLTEENMTSGLGCSTSTQCAFGPTASSRKPPPPAGGYWDIIALVGIVLILVVVLFVVWTRQACCFASHENARRNANYNLLE